MQIVELLETRRSLLENKQAERALEDYYLSCRLGAGGAMPYEIFRKSRFIAMKIISLGIAAWLLSVSFSFPAPTV